MSSKKQSFGRRLLAVGALWAVPLAASLGISSHAATFQSNFASDPGGIALGKAKIDGGVLKLIDLADLINEDGQYTPSRLPLQGSYILPTIDTGKVASFKATFKARIGGGSERPAQGFSFVLAGDFPDTNPFREAGGSTTGLTISFDTYDSIAPPPGVAGNTEGNIAGDAPGIIVKQGGRKVMAKRFAGLRTDGANSTTPVFVPVEINLDADGTLDVTYNGTKVYDNVPIGYVPVAGAFGFGSGTEEITIAQRDNHWIDDLSITTTVVSGAHVISVSPPTQDALPNAPILVTLQDLGAGAVELKLDNSTITPVRQNSGNQTTLSYTPPSLFVPGSSHTLTLTYAGKSFLYSFTVLNAPIVPASAAVSAGSVDTSKGGFAIRTHQTAASQPELTAIRAERQLAGLLGPNIADLSGADSKGVFARDLVNFEQDARDAGVFNSNEGHGDDLIPGIPGTDGGTDNIAMEIVGFLDLQPGVYTIGGASDDSLRIVIGQDPRDATALLLAETAGGITAGSFVIQQAGIYPIRALWTEGGGGASVELWSQDATGRRILLNDRQTPGAIKSYRARSSSFKSAPYLSLASPAPKEQNVPTRPKISLRLTDDGTSVDANTVKLLIDGSAVPAAVAKDGTGTTVTFQPSSQLSPTTDHVLTLNFSDTAGTAVSRSYAFTTGKAEAVGGTANTVKGYWNFKNGNLAASIGKDLGFIDSSLANLYQFGTSGQGSFATVPSMNGKPVKFLHIPYTDTAEGNFKKIGLRMKHGILPNGGGQKVNQWTLIMDVLWGDNGPSGFAGVVQTHDLDNPGDADMFWRARDGSYGKSCCSTYDGLDQTRNHPRNEWKRVVFTVDLAASPRVVGKFINGFKHTDKVTSNGDALDSRFAMPAEVFLFGDGDDNERTESFVSAIQVREGRMSDEDVAGLGGPDADGIPTPYSQWEFDNPSNPLAAKAGFDLSYIDNSVSGLYKTGITGQGAFADVPGINGTPVQALYIPYTETAEGNFKKIGLKMKHGLAPNGGGKNVNQWTLIMDVLWGDNGPSGFAGVIQTHDLANPGDADMFWRARDGSYGKSCCSTYDGLDQTKNHPRKEWRRVVFTVDLAASPRVVGKYIDGFKHTDKVTSNGDALDSRFSLPPEIFLFGDGDDNERTDCYVSSLQVRQGRMTDEEIAALGKASPQGIPSPNPIKGEWNFDQGNLAATIGQDLSFIDSSLAGNYKFGTTGQGSFSTVPNINGKSAKVLYIPYTDTAEGNFKKIGLKMKHGISPNGGGVNVNQWTLIMDVLWGDNGPSGFAGVFQTHDLANPGDADMFWRARDGSYGKSCCSTYDGLDQTKNHPRNEWKRVVFTVDLAASPRVVGKFINGFKHTEKVTSNGDALDSRFSLPAEILLFGDGDDNERTDCYVNAVQIREGRMSDEAIAALGGPDADGIPAASAGSIPVSEGPVTPPTMTVVRNATGTLTISWQSSASFTLESKASLSDVSWTQVTGVSGNSATITPGAGAAFYRLRK